MKTHENTIFTHGCFGPLMTKEGRKKHTGGCPTKTLDYGLPVIMSSHCPLMYEKVLYIIAKKGLGNPTVVDKKSFNKVCASYHQCDIVLQDGSEFLYESYLTKPHLRVAKWPVHASSQRSIRVCDWNGRNNFKYDGCSTNTAKKNPPHFRSLQ